jgi:hypothetical protein
VIGSATATTQAALYTKLTGDTTMMNMLASPGVIDMANVANTQTFPYLTLGDVHEQQGDTFTSRIYELAYTIHIWTRSSNTQHSFRPAQGILARLITLLHRQALAVQDQRHIGTWYLDTVELLDPDGLTQHLAVQFRIEVEEDF